jgi:hypothetical protein
MLHISENYFSQYIARNDLVHRHPSAYAPAHARTRCPVLAGGALLFCIYKGELWPSNAPQQEIDGEEASMDQARARR